MLDWSAVNDQLGIMQYEVQPILSDLNGGSGTTTAPDVDDWDAGGSEDDGSASAGGGFLDDPIGGPRWFEEDDASMDP